MGRSSQSNPGKGLGIYATLLLCLTAGANAAVTPRGAAGGCPAAGPATALYVSPQKPFIAAGSVVCDRTNVYRYVLAAFTFGDRLKDRSSLVRSRAAMCVQCHLSSVSCLRCQKHQVSQFT